MADKFIFFISRLQLNNLHQLLLSGFCAEKGFSAILLLPNSIFLLWIFREIEPELLV